MSDLTDERRAAIARREAEATPGPWTADTEQRGDCVVWGPDGKFIANMGTAPHWVPDESGERRHVAFDVDRRDAEFIAHARQDVPLLLAALAESEKNARDAGFALARQAPTVARARGWERRAEAAEAELDRHKGYADDWFRAAKAAGAALEWVRDMCTDPWKVGMMDANVMAFADLIIKGLGADSAPTSTDGCDDGGHDPIECSCELTPGDAPVTFGLAVPEAPCSTCHQTGWIHQEGQIGAPGSGGTHGCPDCTVGRERLARGELREDDVTPEVTPVSLGGAMSRTCPICARPPGQPCERADGSDRPATHMSRGDQLREAWALLNSLERAA